MGIDDVYCSRCIFLRDDELRARRRAGDTANLNFTLIAWAWRLGVPTPQPYRSNPCMGGTGIALGGCIHLGLFCVQNCLKVRHPLQRSKTAHNRRDTSTPIEAPPSAENRATGLLARLNAAWQNGRDTQNPHAAKWSRFIPLITPIESMAAAIGYSLRHRLAYAHAHMRSLAPTHAHAPKT